MGERWRLVAIGAVAVLIVVALVVVIGRRGSGGSHTIAGALLLQGRSTFGQYGAGPTHEGDPCTSGGEGYSDIESGASVVVKDGAGKVIATGALDAGRAANTHRNSVNSSLTFYDCRFPFTVTSVPDKDFYGIEVSHRGVVTFSRNDMESKGWKPVVTLGS